MSVNNPPPPSSGAGPDEADDRVAQIYAQGGEQPPPELDAWVRSAAAKKLEAPHPKRQALRLQRWAGVIASAAVVVLSVSVFLNPEVTQESLRVAPITLPNAADSAVDIPPQTDPEYAVQRSAYTSGDAASGTALLGANQDSLRGTKQHASGQPDAGPTGAASAIDMQGAPASSPLGAGFSATQGVLEQAELERAKDDGSNGLTSKLLAVKEPLPLRAAKPAVDGELKQSAARRLAKHEQQRQPAAAALVEERELVIEETVVAARHHGRAREELMGVEQVQAVGADMLDTQTDAPETIGGAAQENLALREQLALPASNRLMEQPQRNAPVVSDQIRADVHPAPYPEPVDAAAEIPRLSKLNGQAEQSTERWQAEHSQCKTPFHLPVDADAPVVVGTSIRYRLAQKVLQLSCSTREWQVVQLPEPSQPAGDN